MTKHMIQREQSHYKAYDLNYIQKPQANLSLFLQVKGSQVNFLQ